MDEIQQHLLAMMALNLKDEAEMAHQLARRLEGFAKQLTQPAAGAGPLPESAGHTVTSPSAAAAESTTPPTPATLLSDPDDIPTFHVEVECGCAGHNWIEWPEGVWELRCRHGALWARVEIVAPDCAPPASI